MWRRPFERFVEIRDVEPSLKRGNVAPDYFIHIFIERWVTWHIINRAKFVRFVCPPFVSDRQD